LGVNGPTPNDAAASCTDGAGDCDTGPNDLQNFPMLSPASTWGSDNTIVLAGSLGSRPNSTYTIEFFASHALNAAGLAEGEIYLGSTTVSTGPTGDAAFSVQLPTADPLHDGS